MIKGWLPSFSGLLYSCVCCGLSLCLLLHLAFTLILGTAFRSSVSSTLQAELFSPNSGCVSLFFLVSDIHFVFHPSIASENCPSFLSPFH